MASGGCGGGYVITCARCVAASMAEALLGRDGAGRACAAALRRLPDCDENALRAGRAACGDRVDGAVSGCAGRILSQCLLSVCLFASATGQGTG
eukprot:2028504-Prymnesium_polylepis.1